MKKLKGKKFLSGYYSKILIYLVRFLVISIPIIFVFEMEFYSLRVINGILAQFLLKIFGINADFFYSSPSLIFGEKIVLISSACTGVRSFYLLFAILFSFRKNYKEKFKYLFIGGIILFFLNILRIFASSLIFFLSGFKFDNFFWSIGLNFSSLIIAYLFVKNNSNKSLI